MDSERIQNVRDDTNNLEVAVGDEDDLTNMDTNENMNTNDELTNKRARKNDSEEGWQKVTRKRKSIDYSSMQSEEITWQICVYSKEKFPKRFALAKLLNEYKITGVTKVKYVNPYKLVITFDKEINAEKFISCSGLNELGWRRQKTWEVGLCYGIIKDIDVDLSEEELLKYIHADTEVVIAKRLNRRNEQGWTPSETVRIGFKGTYLPNYVYLMDLRLVVAPFVFPVTQCSRCWRYGHTSKMCPSNKPVCPKCGKNDHANCDISIYKCVNCSANHISLSRDCPMYGKEKRIREIMSQLKCTYQKALTHYTPPPRRIADVNKPSINISQSTSQGAPSTRPPSCDTLIRNEQLIEDNVRPNITSQQARKKKKKVPFRLADNVVADMSVTDSEGSAEPETSLTNETNDVRSHRETSSLRRLWEKIKETIENIKQQIQTQFKDGLKIFVDWLNIFLSNLIPDMSLIKNIFTSVNG